MVQVLPRANPTFGEQVSAGIGSGLQQGADFGKMFLKNALDRKLQSEKLRGDVTSGQESAKTIEKFFGPNAAELWPHLTEGGRTELFRSLILGKERNRDTNEIISEYFQSNPEEAKNVAASASSMENAQQDIAIEQAGISEKGKEELSKKGIEESEKYLKEVREKYQRSHALKPVFAGLRESVSSGGTKAFSGGNLADIGNKMGGFLGNTLNATGKALESGETAKFRTLSKKLLDEMKDIFGGQIRVKELEVFLSMLPEIGKSNEANLASIDVLERLSEASTMFYDTAQEVIQSNNGKIPKNLAEIVQKKLKPQFADIANRINSTTRNFEKQEKSLTRDIASEILKEAKGDRELARKIAKKRGYQL